MSKRDIKLYLMDIIDEINRIKKFTSDIKDENELVQDERTFYATLKCFENIGEAVKHLPEEVRNLEPLEWNAIAGFRDVIIHEYFGISEKIVWDIIKNKLSKLEDAVKSILEKLKES